MTSIFNMNNSTNCPVCLEPHTAQTKCSQVAVGRRVQALSDMVEKLKEANSIIPGLLKTNKELVESANTLQTLAKDTTFALSLMEQVCKETQDSGEIVWARFTQRLEEEWAKGTTSQDTKELKTSEENSTLKETESKPSIEGTQGGVIIRPNF